MMFKYNKMFRKIGHILLIAILLIATMGFSLSKHYCGSRLVEVKINTEAKSCCANGCKSNCCHNENIHYQLKENFVGSAHQEVTQAVQLDLLFPAESTLFAAVAGDIVENAVYPKESPPPKPLHIKLSEIQTYLL